MATMRDPEIIYQYLTQYVDCDDDSDDAIEASNNALFSLVELLEEASQNNIFTAQDIPTLFNIIFKIETNLENEQSTNIEWSVKDQILKLSLNLVCSNGVPKWCDTLVKVIKQYRSTSKPYLKVAVEHILSCFIFTDTNEDRATSIENRIFFLETLQRTIPDCKKMLLKYFESYLEEWMDSCDVTPKERKELERVAREVGWDTNKFCLTFYDPEADKNSSVDKKRQHMLVAALHLNLHLYQFYTFLKKQNNEKIDFRKVNFLSEW